VPLEYRLRATNFHGSHRLRKNLTSSPPRTRARAKLSNHAHETDREEIKGGSDIEWNSSRESEADRDRQCEIAKCYNSAA
jgi:hypothetical protein